MLPIFCCTCGSFLQVLVQDGNNGEFSHISLCLKENILKQKYELIFFKEVKKSCITLNILVRSSKHEHRSLFVL